MSSDFEEKVRVARRLIACEIIQVHAMIPFNRGIVQDEYEDLSAEDYSAIEEEVVGILRGVDAPSSHHVEAAREFLAGLVTTPTTTEGTS